MLASAICFRSPMDEINSKDAFVKLDTQFRQLVISVSVKWIISEKEQAFAMVHFKMALPADDTLDIDFSEKMTVKEQKIVSIRSL